MAKQAFAKEYAVSYKALNDALKRKRIELKALQKRVILTAKIDLELQIKAMDLLISTCKKGNMSRFYKAAISGKMSKGCKR